MAICDASFFDQRLQRNWVAFVQILSRSALVVALAASHRLAARDKRSATACNRLSNVQSNVSDVRRDDASKWTSTYPKPVPANLWRSIKPRTSPVSATVA